MVAEKSNLHTRNKHRNKYDFKQLIAACPELKSFVVINAYGNESVNFSDPNAVKMLNKALLKQFYHISYWDIPKQYLCPPIPGRADYIHYLADLLASFNNGKIPSGKTIKGLDIGVGANGVYPLIGHHEYGWSFVGSDIDAVAIQSAQKIVDENKLTDSIELRLQFSSTNIFNSILQKNDRFDFTMCNPPFHASAAEAAAGALRKVENLTAKKILKPVLNFGGQQNELWTKGGEEAFIKNMIDQSAYYPAQCFWYSTLVSKKDNLRKIYQELKKVNAVTIKTIDMAQGQKTSRIVAWTFLTSMQQQEWQKKYWG
jgi:23S rRNA (adenine1618-N6)-methyltransferase